MAGMVSPSLGRHESVGNVSNETEAREFWQEQMDSADLGDQE